MANDDIPLKSFVTRKRSMARRSVHGAPKGLFNLSSPVEAPTSNGSERPRRPVSIMGAMEGSHLLNTNLPNNASNAGSSTNAPNTPVSGNPNGAGKPRPMSMISINSGTSANSMSFGRNQLKIELNLDSDPSTVSIPNSSNVQTFNQNVLRNNFSSMDKKIFNTPQMHYSPELNNDASSNTVNLGPNFGGPSTNTEKKFNLGNNGSNSSYAGSSTGFVNPDLEYNSNIRAIHRQYNTNKFNVSLKTDLLKDIKVGKSSLIKEFEKIQENSLANSKTPVVNSFSISKKPIDFDEEMKMEDINWEFWKSVIDHYPSKMSKVKSLKQIQQVFSEGVPKVIRPLIYVFLTNSKSSTIEKIYKENSVISFFSKENDLRLRICETFNLDLRCLKSNQEMFDIEDLDKELLQKVDKDLFEILRNFTIYYDRGGYSEIKGLLSPGTSPKVNDDSSTTVQDFYLPSKAIISICNLLLKTCCKDTKTLEIKSQGAKLSKAEIFGLLIMLNENYFNFDNEINSKNVQIMKSRKRPDRIDRFEEVSNLSSRRSSMTLDNVSVISNNTSPKLNILKHNYQSEKNKEKFVYLFNRSLEDRFPEVLLHLSSNGISTNILIERFVMEFFHRYSVNYKWFDSENDDEKKIKQNLHAEEIQFSDFVLNKTEVEIIQSSIDDVSGLNMEEFFENCYKLKNEDLLRILDMVMIQGTEFLIKFLLLLIEKNYFTIFKIKDSKLLLKFLMSNCVFNFLKRENYKFTKKMIYEKDIDKYENVYSFTGLNPFEQEAAQAMSRNSSDIQEELEEDEEEMDGDSTIKKIAKDTPIRSNLLKEDDRMIEITIREKKHFTDFIKEALKFEPSIYKYEEEIRILEKARESTSKLGMSNYQTTNSSISLASTVTSMGSSSEDLGKKFIDFHGTEEFITPEIKEVQDERKDHKVKLMKLTTDLNNLTLTHKSYKEEILIKNDRLNKIKNENLELKVRKEELERKLYELKLKEELFHSVIRNRNIDKMNEEVRAQIEVCADDVRNATVTLDKYKTMNKKMKDKYEVAKPAKSSGGWFSFGKK